MGLETFFSPSEQAAFFLYSVLMGACLGVVFDVFRALRAIIPHTPFFVGVEDILFAAVWGLSLIVFSMEICRGEIRIYYFVGNVLGFALYFFYRRKNSCRRNKENSGIFVKSAQIPV